MDIKTTPATGTRHSRLTARLLVGAFLTSAAAFIPPTPANAQLQAADLLDRLRAGGLVIYIRHASTERDYADQVTADPMDCGTQRTLSREGWQEAALIGAAFDVLNVPIGGVYSSQYCRAWQTAKIAFGQTVELSALNFEPAEDYTQAQVSAMRDRVLPLLRIQPLPGTNLVFVGHDDPFEAVTGVYPEPMGVTYVLKPNADGVEILGKIDPAQWVELLALR